MQTLTAPSRQRSGRATGFSIRFGPRSQAWVAAGVFIAVLCATRLLGITHHSLWYDEAYTLNLVDTRSVGQFLQAFSTYTASEHLQPLYYFLLYGWSRVAGDSDLALRLPSALFSIASGLILLLLVRMLAPRRLGFGLALLTLFAASSYSIYFAQEARPYALLQMLSFALIALWIRQKLWLVRLGQPLSLISRIGFAVVAALCVLASAFTAALVLCLSAAELSMLRSVRRWWRVWGASIIASTVLVAVYAAVLQRYHVAGATRDFVVLRQSLLMNIPYLFSGLLFGSTLPPGPQALHGAGKRHALVSALPVLALCAITIALAAAAGYRLLRSTQTYPLLTRIFALSTAFYVVLLFAGFGWLGRLNVLPRHGSALFAMLFGLVALAGASYTGGHRRYSTVYAVAFVSVLACNLLSVWEYFSNDVFRKDDYRAAAHLLRAREPLPAFVIQGQPALFQHYGVSTINATLFEPVQLSSFIRLHTAPRDSFRLLVNRYRGYLWDHAESAPAMLAAQYNCRLEGSFSYMEVDLCRPRERDASAPPFGSAGAPAQADGSRRDR